MNGGERINNIVPLFKKGLNPISSNYRPKIPASSQMTSLQKDAVEQLVTEDLDALEE